MDLSSIHGEGDAPLSEPLDALKTGSGSRTPSRRGIEATRADPFARIITVTETSNGASPERETPCASGSCKVILS
jgi:hypothetical protein